MFELELNFFKDNQVSLYKKYADKVLIIHETNILHAVNTLKDAYKYAIDNNLLGTVSIQKCGYESNVYTSTVGLIN